MGPTALLIEPKPSARDQVREALEALDWAVVPTGGVAEATRVLRELRERGPALAPVAAVVCDYEALVAAWIEDAGSAAGSAAGYAGSTVEREPTVEPRHTLGGPADRGADRTATVVVRAGSADAPREARGAPPTMPMSINAARQRVGDALHLLRQAATWSWAHPGGARDDGPSGSAGADPSGRSVVRGASVVIVVTSDEPTPVQHEAAIAGGATAFLSEADATRTAILRHYLDAFRAARNAWVHGFDRPDPSHGPQHGRHASARRLPRPATSRPASAPPSPPSGQARATGHARGDDLERAADRGGVADERVEAAENATGGATGAPASLAAAFRLATPDLREQGALSIRRIADYLGVAQQDVAAAIGVKPKAASARPALPARGPALQPFADVIALVRDVYDGDHDRVRAWLRAPRPELSGRTPLAVMLEPGHVVAVRDLVETAWAGDPD